MPNLSHQLKAAGTLLNVTQLAEKLQSAGIDLQQRALAARIKRGSDWPETEAKTCRALIEEAFSPIIEDTAMTTKYNPRELPADVAIHADAKLGSAIITRINTDRFSEDIKALLASEGIWGAYRTESGFVTVQDRHGKEIWTDIEVSPDGHVLA